MPRAHNSSLVNKKAVLCYPCALRMSILFRVPNPPTCKQLSQRQAEQTVYCANKASDGNSSNDVNNASLTPLFDNEYNKYYCIVHETINSIKRLGVVSNLCSEEEQEELSEEEELLEEKVNFPRQEMCSNSIVYDKLDSVEDDDNNNNSNHTIHTRCKWLCVACYGLYQFLDLFHAPYNAAQIRCTQYNDSQGISVNMNVNRSLTFTWLAAAVYFYTGSKLQHQEEEEENAIIRQDKNCAQTVFPNANGVIPEELSSFKELYMSDLRARILSYLTVSHDQLVEQYKSENVACSNNQLQSLEEQYDEEGNSSSNKVLLPCENVTEYDSTRKRHSSSELPGLLVYMKSIKHYVRKTMRIAQQESSEFELKKFFALSSSVINSLTQHRFAPQAFTYNIENTSLVVEVVCRHRPTEGLVTSEGVLPKSITSNRSDSVLTYGVIYSHVLPYLRSINYLPLRSTYTCTVDISESTPLTCLEKEIVEDCEHEEESNHQDLLVANTTLELATVVSIVSHANIYLIGNYCKMKRQLSQSPWFTNGNRVGTFSLQEIIANQLLDFFFPFGVTPVLPTTDTNIIIKNNNNSNNKKKKNNYSYNNNYSYISSDCSISGSSNTTMLSPTNIHHDDSNNDKKSVTNIEMEKCCQNTTNTLIYKDHSDTVSDIKVKEQSTSMRRCNKRIRTSDNCKDNINNIDVDVNDYNNREESSNSNTSPSLMAASHVYGYGRYKFHSAGREDVDVRMLGAGRPFVLELISPSREVITPVDLTNFMQQINESEDGAIKVNSLRVTDADVTVRLARHSESKIKHYRCVIWCSRALMANRQIIDTDTNSNNVAISDEVEKKSVCCNITEPNVVQSVIDEVNEVNSITDLLIEQTTPLRVLHRRALCVRPRTIHSMHLQVINAHWALLDLTTQAGTYVKEFVHGDMGRTLPNLASLLHGRTDIIQLDVVGMDMHNFDNLIQ